MNKIPGMPHYWVEAKRDNHKRLLGYGVWHDAATACECVKEFLIRPVDNRDWQPALKAANDYRDQLNRGAT